MNSDSEGEETTFLATYYDPMEAEIVVGKLRSAGIEVYVREKGLPSVFALTAGGEGQRDIFVRTSDVEEAKAVLDTEE